MRTDAARSAEMKYDARGAELRLAGKLVGRIDGTARLVTATSGAPKSLEGIGRKAEKISLRLEGQPARELTIQPNQRVTL
jgi:hypothetical protein